MEVTKKQRGEYLVKTANGTYAVFQQHDLPTPNWGITYPDGDGAIIWRTKKDAIKEVQAHAS